MVLQVGEMNLAEENSLFAVFILLFVVYSTLNGNCIWFHVLENVQGLLRHI